MLECVSRRFFSDPAIARPLIETAKGILVESPADVIVDLGGGTGFLLSQFKAQGICGDAALLNIDCSEDQIALSAKEGIPSLCMAIGSFKRSDVVRKGSHAFFIMRSVLHYFGKDGLLPLLRHLRAQAEPGEFFVHQTASFDKVEEAACLNALYRRKRTHKWYPTVNALQRRLRDAGWSVIDTTRAPILRLTSDDLSRRYELNANDIALICKMIRKKFGDSSGVFRLTSSGFHADLHYHIYSCVAAAPPRFLQGFKHH